MATIAWIEDDSDIIEPVIRPLKLAGHEFRRFRSATEALEAIGQIREADLILLDVILPAGPAERRFSRYAGRDVLRELRQVYGLKIPVVVLTVVTREDVLQEIRELGVSDIVRKPVLPLELKDRVERALQG